MHSRPIMLAIALVLGMGVYAWGEKPADLAPILSPVQAEHRPPGLAAAVLRDGKVIAAGAVGVRKLGAGAPLTIEDLFHIGSCTKAMTATLAANIVRDDLIQWNSSIVQILGNDFEVNDAWRGVTLEQLLNHRGGAPGDLPPKVFASRGQNTAVARRELVQTLLSAPPGKSGDFVYSNAGYVIAGAMLEKVAKKPWETLMHERIFAPLGMTTAGFGAPGTPGSIDQPRGHRADGTALEPTPFADNPLAIGPAGTVHMSLADWLKFAALHIRGGRANERPQEGYDLLGITPATFRRMHTAKGDGRGSYAFGWAIANSRQAGIPVLAHDGSNTMWYATIWASPKLDLAVVVVANQGGDRAAQACKAALDAILNEQLNRPDSRE